MSILGITVASAAVVPGATPATQTGQDGAQSAAELRRQNTRLRAEREELSAQVAKLRADLTAAREEIARLNADLEAARSAAPQASVPAGDAAAPTNPAGPNDTADPTAPKPVITVDESKPSAGPRAFRAALLADWLEAHGDLEVGVDGRSPARLNYLRAATNWTSRSRVPVVKVTWIVEPVDPAPGGGPVDVASVRLWEAVDPISGESLGRAFPMRISPAALRRFERGQARGPRGGDAPVPTTGKSGRPQYEVEGHIIARLVVDPARPTVGTFDNPPLLTACITCELGVEADGSFAQRVEATDDP